MFLWRLQKSLGVPYLSILYFISKLRIQFESIYPNILNVLLCLNIYVFTYIYVDMHVKSHI